MGFLKWIGNRSSVMRICDDYFPNFNSVKGYIEPFLGGGNVFFYVMTNYGNMLKGKPVFISDINSGLINCYKTVRDSLDDIIPLLMQHEKLNDEEYYYRVRKEYNHPRYDPSRVEKAGMFMYLNNASSRGWRENNKGEMNQPYGNFPNLNLINDELVVCSKILQNAKINCMSFEKVLNFKDIKGFFIQMDPPFYDLGRETSNFTQYSGGKFHLCKKVLLSGVFKELDKIGCKVMMSNSDVNIVQRDFEGFNIYRIQTNRINGNERQTEVIVTNYPRVKKQLSIDDYWSQIIDR